ncbi:MAG: phage terminase small subunit P27 family [Cyanobacteria bacterium SZAS-4]|nr:phage terminase small subunit P27 family [Cyanobacteria bacterium SZAS-4]
MTRPGPAPKPTKMKLLNGNPGKRRITKREPKPKLGSIVCPAHLTGIARQEWNRLAPQLREIGLLTDVDLVNFEGLCVAYQRAREADRCVAKEGLQISSRYGARIANPNVEISRKCWQEVRKFAQEFGFSPSSRSRLEVNLPAGQLTAEEQQVIDLLGPE